MVMIRTASSSGSGTTVSTTRVPSSAWRSAQSMNWRRGAPPALGKAQQVVVGAGEGGRAQRCDESDFVSRVVDGAQDGDQVAHLLGVVHERAALDPIGAARVLQRLLDRR